MAIKSRIDFTAAPSIQLTFIGYNEVEMGQKSFHLKIISKVSLYSMGMMLVVMEVYAELLLGRQTFLCDFLLLLQDGNEMNVFILKSSNNYIRYIA